MVLSWNEIRDRALKFSKEWGATSNEEAGAKPFLVDFLMCLALTIKEFRPLNIGFKNWMKKMVI